MYEIRRELLSKNNVFFIKAVQNSLNGPKLDTFCGFTVTKFLLWCAHVSPVNLCCSSFALQNKVSRVSKSDKILSGYSKVEEISNTNLGITTLPYGSTHHAHNLSCSYSLELCLQWELNHCGTVKEICSVTFCLSPFYIRCSIWGLSFSLKSQGKSNVRLSKSCYWKSCAQVWLYRGSFFFFLPLKTNFFKKKTETNWVRSHSRIADILFWMHKDIHLGQM